VLPEWFGPPKGWLGGFVPLRLELLRTAEAVMFLGGMEAFPQGVHVELAVETRSPAVGPPIGPMGSLGDGFRLGVAYSDGRKWQGTDVRPGALDTPPPAPHVQFSGGGGGGRRYAMRLWLWPLPPPGPVTFAVAAPSLDVDEQIHVVDADVFRRAAAEASKLWDPLSDEEETALHRQQLERMRGIAPGRPSVQTILIATKPDEEDEPEAP
jgi:hypothetical protein